MNETEFSLDAPSQSPPPWEKNPPQKQETLSDEDKETLSDEDKEKDTLRQLRNDVASRFEQVARMLRNDKLQNVSITLDGSGNQKISVFNPASQRQYLVIIRMGKGVEVEADEAISVKYTRAQRLKSVRELHRQGLSQKRIAERLGVTQQTISNDLQQIKEIVNDKL